jgi:CBS domain-containing protein
MPPKKKARAAGPQDFQSMTVKQVMETQVQCAGLTTKGDVIASLMIEGFGSVPVLDGRRRLVGIVSEHDLLGAMDDGHELGTVTARDVMTGNPYSVRPETTLGTLVRVPVVDEQDRLIGIVARRDVLRTYLGCGTRKRK